MLTFLIILAIVVAGVVVWRRRVPLMAKLLGQSESRSTGSSTASAELRRLRLRSVDVLLGAQLLERLGGPLGARLDPPGERLALPVEQEVGADPADHEAR